MRPSGRTQGVLSCSRLADRAPQVPAVGVAAPDVAHLGEPAVDPAVGPGGDEHDAAVGQPAGLVVVVRPVGDLPQAGAIGVDRVEQVVLGPALAVGEQDPPAVVVHARVAQAALGIVQQHGDLAGAHVQFAELAVLARHDPLAVGREVADVGVPVLVDDAVDREDDLFDAGQGPGEEVLDQVGVLEDRGRRLRAAAQLHVVVARVANVRQSEFRRRAVGDADAPQHVAVLGLLALGRDGGVADHARQGEPPQAPGCQTPTILQVHRGYSVRLTLRRVLVV